MNHTEKQSNQVKKTQKKIQPHEFISPSHLRNYLLKDPILDWLKDSNACPNSQSSQKSFTSFIMEQGNKFETIVVDKIKQKFFNYFVDMEKSPISYEKVEATIREMKKGTPIIYQGQLMNEEYKLNQEIQKIYGIPDLIVRSDYVNKLVDAKILTKDQQATGSKFSRRFHYVIIDIKFSTLPLCANGSNILNSGSFPAYKGQIYMYNYMLSKVQEYDPKKGYILGRGYRYKKQDNKYESKNSMDTLGEINFEEFDSETANNVNKAMTWINKLRKHSKEWTMDIYDKLPLPCKELYPNMCNQYDAPYRQIKETIAKKIGEISLLWYVGVKERLLAHSQQIYSVYDDKINADTLGINNIQRAGIINSMIEINRKTSKKKIMPRVLNDPDIINFPENKVYFLDFETISDVVMLDDDRDMFSQGEIIFMIGVGHYDQKEQKWEYKSFVADTLSLEDEKKNAKAFYDYINSWDDPPLCIHWSNAEIRMWNACIRKHNMPECKLVTYDLMELFTSEPIIIKGCYNFSLKNIVKSLHEHKFINCEYKGVSSGMDAMVYAYDVYVNKKDKQELKNIIDYNEVDCQALYKILTFLRERYCQDMELDSKHNEDQSVKKTLGKRKILHEPEDIEPVQKKKKVSFKLLEQKEEKGTDIESSDTSTSSDEDTETDTDSDNEQSEEETDEEEKKSQDEKKNRGEEKNLEEKLEYTYDTKIIKEYLKGKLPEIEHKRLNQIANGMGTELFDSLCSSIPVYNRWKVGKPEHEVQMYTEMLNKFRQEIQDSKPDMYKILKSDLSDIDKKNAIRLYDLYMMEADHTQDKLDYEKEILSILNKNRDHTHDTDVYEQKILNLTTNDTVKGIIRARYYELVHTGHNHTEGSEIRKWLNWVIELPYDTKVDNHIVLDTKEQLTEYCSGIMDYMNKELYKMVSVKEKFIEIIVNRIRNANGKSGIIALKGVPGCGKSTIAKVIANALKLPFERISLGGCSDSTIFKGCVSSWSGSGPSMILQSMRNMKCSNGILILDEIDKIAGNGISTARARELQSSLLQVLDYTQNNEYRDDFICEFSHNISNLWFICTLNDDQYLEPALKDRLNIIEVKDYDKKDKKHIIQNYIFSKGLKDRNMTSNDCILTDEAIDYILETDKLEHGLRTFEKIIYNVLDKINLLKHTDLHMSYSDKSLVFPIKLTQSVIEKFLNRKDENNVNWRTLYL